MAVHSFPRRQRYKARISTSVSLLGLRLAYSLPDTMKLLLILLILLIILLTFIFTSLQAQASMVGMAIAVQPAQVPQLTENEESLAKALFQTKDSRKLDLDKAWHGIHFILTRTAWDASSLQGQAILGGREFGPEMGYGHPRLISATDTKKIADVLDKETPQAWSVRFSPPKMEAAPIYPDIGAKEGPAALQYLLHYFTA